MPQATDKFRLLTPFGSLFDSATLGINIDINECQWADLNRRPRRYECRALTN